MMSPFKKTLLSFAFVSAGLAALIPATALAQTAAKRSNAAQPAKPPFPVLHFNAKSNGEKAISNLGSSIAAVAAFYGKTASDLREQLLHDKSAWIDHSGRLFFIETALTTSGSDLAPTGMVYPPEQSFFLHSRPSSKRKIYLDFNGHTTSGTAWNTSYGVDPIISPAFDLDGVPGTFNSAELTMIQNIWRRVAEDYASFDVDVTTEEPTIDQMSRSSLSDDTYGTRAVISKNFTAGTTSGDCGCGGFAYVGIFDSTSEAYKPAFIFQDKLGNGEKAIAEALSHEVGHNLGLSHDGTSTLGYYQGQGSGVTGWAPIMGVGYYKELTQFSKGEYLDANNKEDDFLVMQSNGVMFAADDFGNTMATAAALSGTAANGYNSFDVNGVIESPADVDFFKFPSAAGTVTINAKPFERSPNLDILLQLFDASGVLIAEANPLDLLNASISMTIPSAGTYFLSIQGSGKGDPLVTGYSDYGSIGRYAVSVSAPLAGGFPTAVISSNVSSGPAPLSVTFDGSASSDPSGAIQSYLWNFGDGSATASGATASHTYSVAGSYSASLTVSNSSGFTDIKSLSITATSVQPKIFAASIAMSLAANNARQSYAQAKVTVKDSTGKLIPGASVTGAWSGIVSGSNTVLTDASGVATSKSSPSKKPGTFKYTITGISAAGYAYDANLNTMSSNSITK
ncbi:MAG: PKD domain-containing protein [Pseudomonadota bacterium]